MKKPPILVLGAALLFAAPVPAAAATSEPATGNHCAYLLDRLRPGETASRVLSQSCGPSREETAAALGVAADTLLLTIYEDAGYGGDTVTWYGKYGPCDTAGYSIRDLETQNPFLTNMNDKISSWTAGHSRCNYVNFYEHAVYGGRHQAWHNWTAVSYVGDYINDRTSSINVHYEP
ncbi:hypothetical protein [Amycolatopsis sp. CA-126428]|uniref:hypothetical protein n=1 Tax=Amycolatopsis sp. CA-126428 TaxID=2073158 RepID=UPI000CD326F9|nr:hypothetical protein [Amycolatopsis sp. CA-126428]